MIGSSKTSSYHRALAHGQTGHERNLTFFKIRYTHENKVDPFLKVSIVIPSVTEADETHLDIQGHAGGGSKHVFNRGPQAQHVMTATVSF